MKIDLTLHRDERFIDDLTSASVCYSITFDESNYFDLSLEDLRQLRDAISDYVRRQELLLPHAPAAWMPQPKAETNGDNPSNA